MKDFWTSTFTYAMSSIQFVYSLNNGVEYDLPVEVTDADQVFAYIVNSRMSGMGQTSGGGNQAPRDHGVWLSGDVLTNIILNRSISSTLDCRVTVAIIAVTKPASTSRFWVRQKGVVSFTSAATETKSTAVTGVVDDTRVWPVITGQAAETSSRPASNAALFNSNYTGGNIVLARGDDAGKATANVSYAVVEFGEDWNPVQRLKFFGAVQTPDTEPYVSGSPWAPSPGDPTLTKTISITDAGGTAVGSLARTFMDCQYNWESAGACGNDDRGGTMELTGTNEITVRTSATAGPDLQAYVVHICEWIGGGAGESPPVAQHISHLQVPGENGGAEEAAIAISMPSSYEIEQEDNTSILGMCVSSDGTGAGTPRGSVDFELTSRTQVTATRSESSRTERRAYIVWEWPVGGTRLYRGSRELGVWSANAVLETWASRGEMGTWDPGTATLEAYKFTAELEEGFGEADMQA